MIGKFLNRNRGGGLIWLIIGIALCIESVKLNLGEFHSPGPGFIGFMAGILLGILGLIQMASTNSKELPNRRGAREAGQILVKENMKRLLVNFSILIGYILLLEPLGFLISTFIFFSTLLKLNFPKKWLLPLVISGSAVIFGHFIFRVWLQVPLPRGIFNF